MQISETRVKGPSRRQLFKLFTDFGPYFRQLKSNENTFFFDCLEICVDVDIEPENRLFLGWWMIVTRSENKFTYTRFNGLFDHESNWVDTTINKKQMLQIDQSFESFIIKLIEMLDVETGCKLSPL